jgi:glycosyltransferase involved in cell wall biosynthesis
MSKQLVGVIGSGLVGRDPFHRRSWSGGSSFLFNGLKEAGALHRAFGVETPALKRYLFMLRNFKTNRKLWRRHFYMDTGYYDSLTQEVRRRLEPGDFEHDFLQLGAVFDVPALLDGRSRCFSYHDANLAGFLRSPDAPPGLSARQIDRALAYERKVYHGMAKIFSMSEYLSRSFVEDFGVPEERVVTIGTGIHFETIPEYISDKQYDSREILFVGVDFPRKGGWELLRAFNRVRRHFPDATLHIVGPKELTIPPELEGGVAFHGYVSREERDALFRRCCLFAMPSLWEPFGVAPLEAMVNQMPCLVTNRWALREMVVPGQTGDLVECGDVDDLEAKLAALLSDPEALRRMGENGRQMVVNNYTWQHVIDKLIKAVSA